MQVIPLFNALPVLGVAIWFVWAAYTIPETPDRHELPPSLPLPPPLMSSLPTLPCCCCILPVPQLIISFTSVERVASWSSWSELEQSPAPPWSEDPQSPPQTTETQTPPLPVDPLALPWILAPSSLPGSLIPPAMPWSVVDLPSPPPASPQPSVPLAQLGSPLRLHLGPLSLLLHRGLPDSPPAPRSPDRSSLVLRILYVTLVLGLSVSNLGSSPTCSTNVNWPPVFVSPSSTMAPPSIGSTMGHLPSWALEHLPSPPAPSSSLCLFHPGLWSSSSQSSGHLQNLLLPVCASPIHKNVPFHHPSTVSWPFTLCGARSRLPGGGDLSQYC